jgi:hypothetical protein
MVGGGRPQRSLSFPSPDTGLLSKPMRHGSRRVATIDERRRHELYVALEELIGAGPTETLMSLLPPVGWANVATKQDLAQVEHLLDARIDSLRTELITKIDSQGNELKAYIELGLRSTMRTLFFSIGSLIVAMTSILLVAT